MYFCARLLIRRSQVRALVGEPISTRVSSDQHFGSVISWTPFGNILAGPGVSFPLRRLPLDHRVARIEQGNLSNDFGAGYRVYFGRDGDVVVILLAGGTKKRQQRDIETARARWADYKQRRKPAR